MGIIRESPRPAASQSECNRRLIPSYIPSQKSTFALCRVSTTKETYYKSGLPRRNCSKNGIASYRSAQCSSPYRSSVDYVSFYAESTNYEIVSGCSPRGTSSFSATSRYLPNCAVGRYRKSAKVVLPSTSFPVFIAPKSTFAAAFAIPIVLRNPIPSSMRASPRALMHLFALAIRSPTYLPTAKMW